MIATAATFRREWSEFLGRPIGLVIKLAYPAAIGVPLLWAPVPPFYAAMAITILLATVAGIGTAAVLGRERSAGLLQRLLLAPRPAGRTVAERVLAGASVDFVQSLPLLLLIALRHPSGAVWWPGLALGLLGTLISVGALGAIASSIATNPGEVMLCVMVPLLPAFFLAGLFVPPFGVLVPISRLFPFFYLHAAIVGALGAAGPVGPAACGLGGVAFCLVGVGACALAGRRVLEAK